MSDSVLALYGSGKGPQVPLYGRKARGKIVGERFDGEVWYHVEREEGEPEAVCQKVVGHFDLPLGDAVTVEYLGGSKGLLCFVETER
jgi:hypothetical protein